MSTSGWDGKHGDMVGGGEGEGRKEAGIPSETRRPIRFRPRALTSLTSCSAPASSGEGGGRLINSAKCL